MGLFGTLRQHLERGESMETLIDELDAVLRHATDVSTAARARHAPAAGLAQRLGTRVATTGDEFLGLGRQSLTPGSFRILCEALCGAPTLAQSIADARYFCHLQTHDVSLRVSRGQSNAKLTVDCAGQHPLFAPLVVTIVQGLLEWVVGREIPVTTKNEAGRAVLSFPPEYLDLPIVRLKRQAGRASRTLIPAILMGGTVPMPLRNRVRACLRRNISRQNRLEDVADELQMLPRALRSDLAADGSPEFRDLKDEVRRQEALLLMQDLDVPLDKLARSVGFAELSTFHRAFRRWTGQTPGDYRKQLSSPH